MTVRPSVSFSFFISFIQIVYIFIKILFKEHFIQRAVYRTTLCDVRIHMICIWFIVVIYYIKYNHYFMPSTISLSIFNYFLCETVKSSILNVLLLKVVRFVIIFILHFFLAKINFFCKNMCYLVILFTF